jgi:ribonucleoside-diphosphate reductase alpha chain
MVETPNYFEGNPLGEFVYLRTYARWLDDKGRRENWVETVDRYMSFMRENLGDKLTEKEYAEVREAILNQEVMPSMRLLQFAGDATRKCNLRAFNCSFVAPTTIEDFGDILYLSASGTGVGFSVETANVQELPVVKKQKGVMLKTHTVADSKEGWSDALIHGMKAWYNGKDIEFDYSLLRPAGARLKTSGGKSSGPGPFKNLLEFTREKILSRQGRRLANIDVHDIICKIGEVIVSGGVRRSALISLSDLDDSDMREAKHGAFYNSEPQRSLANNSTVYEKKPTNEEFLSEWMSLVKSGSGERGIFNRSGLIAQMPKRRREAWAEMGFIENGEVSNLTGTNPCGEIILLSRQLCNLSEIIARADDDEKSLLRKARIATILGTYQSTLTNFKYVNEEWKRNCDAERLLGVSITGQWDSAEARKPDTLKRIKDETIRVNKLFSARFGVGQSTCITAVKPSGTVSQTVNCSSGMHARYAPYYIRRIRISATDSLFKLMRDQGVPYKPEVGQTMDNATTYVLEFPVKSPDGAICTEDLTAIQQLEHWKVVKENYTEHNPSVTVSVGDDEWIEVAGWVYKHWEIVGGLSFLPRSNHVYMLAPYEEITKDEYEKLVEGFGKVDFTVLEKYELSDETEQARELACAGGTCEIN